ncbi:MAG TPA: glycosyltransferase family 4 protein [Prolixibacteraceae bacterium]|nr:glycosyltransferase family 4 protein [Prolixibacteraceae bacterium]
MEALLKYIEPLKETVKIIYDAEAIFAQREIALLELKGEKVNKSLVKQKIEKEILLTNIADTVISVSENDAQYFREYGTHDVRVLGHTIDIKPGSNQFAERKDLLFVGNLDYNESPNTDSLIWFINEVFPIVQQQIKGIKLNVVGSANAPILKKIKNKSVVVHGRVNNTDKFYNQNRVFIAPTRFAAGIPFKIHEAAANGIPVVATKLLCHQLGWKNNEIIIESECNATDFAKKVINLYNDKTLWEQLQNNALHLIKTEMSLDSYMHTIKRILK